MERARQFERLVQEILRKRHFVNHGCALLVGISGIDGSGKSTLAPQLAARLNSLGPKTELIELDDWHNPPALRFNPARPASTFYESGLRHDELFSTLVLPLRNKRSVFMETTISRQPDERPFRHTFHYEDVDIVILEGIFIFKQQYQHHFDFRCWVECPFDVALERALRRNQEGLSQQSLIHAYETIYFPAQRLHFAADRPFDGVDFVFHNADDDAQLTDSQDAPRPSLSGSVQCNG